MHNREIFIGFCVVVIIISLIAAYLIATSDLPLWVKIWLLK